MPSNLAATTDSRGQPEPVGTQAKPLWMTSARQASFVVCSTWRNIVAGSAAPAVVVATLGRYQHAGTAGCLRAYSRGAVGHTVERGARRLSVALVVLRARRKARTPGADPRRGPRLRPRTLHRHGEQRRTERAHRDKAHPAPDAPASARRARQRQARRLARDAPTLRKTRHAVALPSVREWRRQARVTPIEVRRHTGTATAARRSRRDRSAPISPTDSRSPASSRSTMGRSSAASASRPARLLSTAPSGPSTRVAARCGRNPRDVAASAAWAAR